MMIEPAWRALTKVTACPSRHPGILFAFGSLIYWRRGEEILLTKARHNSTHQLHPATVPKPLWPVVLCKQEAPETPRSDVTCCIEGGGVVGFSEVVPSNNRTETTPLNISLEQQVRRAPEHTSPPPSGAAACAGGNKAGFEGFFTIRPSKLGGLGAFATRDLRRGETILTERPLLRTTHFRLMLDYYNLSDAAKKTYLSLHGGEDGDRFGRVERVKVLNS
ncbi:hypothetical protein VTG60DRAFT_2022 [Thermothelomyces hinnuleus]